MSTVQAFGGGTLSRAANAVYWFLAIEALLLLTTAPFLVPILFLAREPGNLPIAAALLVPPAPALAAALFAWRAFLADPDPFPARHFWRGYRVNALDVLRWWVPALAALTALGLSAVSVPAAGLPVGYLVVLAVLAGAVLLWSVNALVLSSALALRARDTARLAAHYLAAKPGVTVGVLALLIVSGAVVVLAGDWALVALASPLTLALTRTAAPVLRDATERFTA